MVHTPAIRKKNILKALSFRFALLAITLIYVLPASAQQSWEAECGIGYYELMHVGIFWNYSQKSALAIYAGSNFKLNNKKMMSAGLAYHQVFIKPLLWKIRPGFALKGQYWSQDDESYLFTNLAFIGQAGLYVQLNRFLVGAEGGGVLNYALQTERKQNITAGSPSRANGNYNFSIRYRLSKQ